jgi:hypothetical protein
MFRLVDRATAASRFCDGLRRRNFLQVGGLGAAGLALPGLFQGQARAAAPGLAGTKAKSCILLFMNGGPPQMDTFDLKPDAPAEVRGDYKPIDTNVPGVRISEKLPMLARHADKYAVIRSVSDNYVGGAHGQSVYLALTGHHSPRVQGDDVRPAASDYPCLGSAVARVRPTAEPVPSFVWLMDMYRKTFAGEGGGFLGRGFDPFWVLQDPNRPNFSVQATTLPRDVGVERLSNRRELLNMINRQAEQLSTGGTAGGLDAHYRKAFNLIGSPQVKKAFDLKAETDAVRDRYGRHKFGQGALLARRLVQHGVPLVTVCWSGEEVNQGWDLHYNSYKNLSVLMPPMDRGFSALLEELSERGMLDDTLVVWMGEFGRAPRLEDKGGRGHWGRCYSVVMAGGGIRGGQVYGRSDRYAAEPAESAVGPADIVATIYHCLGIPADTELPDQLGRPLRLYQGDVVQGLFR